MRYTASLLASLLFLWATGATTLRAQESRPAPRAAATDLAPGTVYLVPIEGEIDNTMARYVDRAVASAEQADASLILLRIDTYGGLLQAGDHIRKSLLNTTVPTVALIDRNAASAGALISYAADRIAMVPGASIGAATVVEGGTGEAAPDKYQSYMRGLMRSTAEANGRDPRIAEAMVDESVVVEGVKPAGKVLTLSAQEAERLGVADMIVDGRKDLLASLGVADQPVLQYQATGGERVLGILGSPLLHVLFLLMMLGGLYFELHAPGLGIAGFVALVGAALFFAPSYLLGLVQSWEAVLFGVGIALVLVEVFLIPGFGFAGITGIALVLFSILAMLVANVGFAVPNTAQIVSAVATLAITLVLLVALGYSLGRYLPRSELFNRLVLANAPDDGLLTLSDTADELLGRAGRAVTPLRPSGMAEIEGARVDVITAGEYVAAGTPVEVVNVRGRRVEVRQIRIGALPETFDA
ncbi:MAG TPA: NfeD family protein [Rhodothermales bacterium]|nr:NfeD family protein [Rhodothermales bacterium]